GAYEGQGTYKFIPLVSRLVVGQGKADNCPSFASTGANELVGCPPVVAHCLGRETCQAPGRMRPEVILIVQLATHLPCVYRNTNDATGQGQLEVGFALLCDAGILEP